MPASIRLLLVATLVVGSIYIGAGLWGTLMLNPFGPALTICGFVLRSIAVAGLRRRKEEEWR